MKKKTFTWDELSDARKIAVAEYIFKYYGIPYEKIKYIFEIKSLDELNDEELEEMVQKFLDEEEYEKAAKLRDKLKGRE